MKNRRNVVIAFMIVAVMLLGIGYATLSDTLDITGSADVNQSAAEEAFNEDIFFSGAVANEKGNTASINADNNDKASFTASTLKGKDDVVTFTFTIENAGDVDATVTPKLNATAGNTNAEYFEITSDWNGQAKDLAAHSTIDYTVTVKLLKTPTETISGSFIIELVAVSKDA
jgi:cytochrome oxidase Cu insertion factor (SCO1/SenC/PrrC family)